MDNEEQNQTEDLVIDPVTDTVDEAKGGVGVGQQLMLVGGIFLLIFGTTLSPRIFSTFLGKDEVKPKPELYTEQAVKNKSEEGTPSEIEPFSEVDIVAHSAYVWDIVGQRALFKKNESQSLPLASVTKLMTALLANEILNENTNVTISDSALNQDGDSGLLRDEVFDRLSLTDLVLMSSSNDGAFALAAAAGDAIEPYGGTDTFVEAMNIRAKELGLGHTVFYNPTGLDLNSAEAGAYGSAKDMAFLMEYIVENSPDILTYTQEDSALVYSESGNYHEANNTNYYIDEISGLIGSKTGYTDLAGGNLIVAYDAGLNRPIVVSVLGSTQQNRFTDVLKLIEETNEYLAEE